jgi:uncharacterized protein with HEPN domain
MLPEESDAAHLWDMLYYSRAILAEVSSMTLEDYRKEDNFRLAIERRIEIIGEAANRVSVIFRKQHPDIPWRPIIAQRNVLAHAYGEIDDERVWQVAVVHIPQLVAMLEPLAPSAPASEE